MTEMENCDKLDTSEILRVLQAGERTLAYLNTRPVKELTDEIKAKIHSTASSYQVFQSRLFNNHTSSSNKLDEVWKGLAMLQIINGKYIKHYNDIDELGCIICKEMFACTQNSLRMHIENKKHIKKCSDNVLNDLHEYYCEDNARNMLKYGKFLDFDGPSGMIFCRACCRAVENDKLELLKHFKEKMHQQIFEELVCSITGTHCETDINELFSVSIPHKKKSYTKKLVEDFIQSAEKRESTSNDELTTDSSMADKSISIKNTEEINPETADSSKSKKMGFTRKLDADLIQPAKKSESWLGRSTCERLEFGRLKKLSDLCKKFHEDELIIPLGLKRVKLGITVGDIERAFKYFGDVILVERPSMRQSLVIIYIVLNDQHRDIFNKHERVKIGSEWFEICNPFLPYW